MSLKSGHSVVPLTDEEQKEQNRQFRAFQCGLVRLQPEGWFFTKPFLQYADKIFNFKFKPSDVVIMSYPKSGTTWTQEIIWTMIKNPNLNNPESVVPINVRSPFVEGDFILKHHGLPPLKPGFQIYDIFVRQYPDRNPEDGILLTQTELAKDPRIIKTHLSFALLSPQLLDTCKIIYVARDPKDVIISGHHHSRLIKFRDFVGSFDEFIDHFLNNRMLYSPYWEHIKEAWKRRDHPNVHFCFYEDIKANPKAEMLRFQKFVGIELTEKQLEQITHFTSFSEMQKRDVVLVNNEEAKATFTNEKIQIEKGGFFRKGEAGSWKTTLSKDQENKINEWIKKNVQAFDPNYKYARELSCQDEAAHPISAQKHP